MHLWYGKGAWSSTGAKQTLAALEPQDINSVAVIRHAGLGDMILTRAFLLELRKCFPNANITLSIVNNYTRGVPEDLVDRVHVTHGSGKKNISFREKIRNFRKLGNHDLIFDLAATTRSFCLCLLNKAKIKVGFPYRHFGRRLFYDVTVPRTDLKFEAEVLIDTLSVLGFKTGYPPKFNLPGQPMARERPYVTYFPGASIIDKCWPAEHFAQAIKHLSEIYSNHDHIVLEGVADWESIDGILSAIGKRPNVEGLAIADLEPTISLLKGSALLVANDTGIRHLAIAAETPTIGIFFLTEPYRYWPRYGKHDAVFNHNGSVPSVDLLVENVQNMLGVN